MIIQEPQSVEEYLESWAKAMADTYWFKEPRLFDYDRNEMAEEIKREFDESKNIYLTAKLNEKEEETVGVLEAKIKDNVGTFGRWEPAVCSKYKRTKVGEALIQEAFSKLRERHSSKARCMLKLPYDSRKTGQWHVSLYERSGFTKREPSSIALLAHLKTASIVSPLVKGIRLVDGSSFSLEDFVRFTRKAYLSTPEDRAVHKQDQHISNSKNNLKVLQAIKDGKFGHSPPDLWKVALIRDEPVGFIILFMPESKYRPPHGVIGELGVFPRFRRRGIASLLIAEAHRHFKNLGCQYSFVGTPKTNTSAIRLYRKTGYRPVFELTDFEKKL